MLEPIRRLLNEASSSKGTKAFWQAAARILSEWARGAGVQLDYRGLNESGTATAGAPAAGGPVAVDWQDADGRRVHGEFAALPPGAHAADAPAAIEAATHLAVMVGRRASLERERRLGTFLVELSRWLLAAPEPELLLRYTLPSLFGLVDLQSFTAVAAYIAGGLELSEAVSGARAAAERARAMVDGSPLPLALVDGEGRVQQLNEAGCRLFGIAAEREARGAHLEALGLSPSGISLRLVLAQPLSGGPWHGRVLVTQASGDRRICDCTITGLSGIDSKNLLVALYDRTDELRAERELVAREKLATVGEIASGAAHEVNNPLAAIRMEAELLARASRDPEVTAAAATMTRAADRAARIVRSLMRLARRADTTPTRVQVNDLVHDVAP